MASPGFSGYGKSGSPACAESPGWARVSLGLVAPPVPGPEGDSTQWAGPGLTWEPLADWPRGPTAVPCGEGLLLTTESGRSQPGWRRRHPLPHHTAGSGRRQRGSSPPRCTVKRETSKQAWGENCPFGEVFLHQPRSFSVSTTSDPPFPFHGIFALFYVTELWLHLPVSLSLSVTP